MRLALLSTSFRFWCCGVVAGVLLDGFSWVVYFLAFEKVGLRFDILARAAGLVVVA